MTARQFVSEPAFKFLSAAVALGIAWGALQAQLIQKADKAELAEVRAILLDVKTILCAKPENAGDSACKQH